MEPAVRELFKKSGVFSSSPDTYLDEWYKLYKVIEPMMPESLLSIGIGKNLESNMWNGMFYELFETLEYFLNIDIDEKVLQKAKESRKRFLHNSQLYDARKLDEQFEHGSMDIIFWSHGPEHVERKDWPNIFPRLEKVANNIVILQCPWGNGYDKDPEHLSKSIEKEEFESFGYTVLTMGTKDTLHANILAYKVV